MPVSPTAIQHAMSAAANALRAGNLSDAETALLPFLSGTQSSNPDLLNIAGTLRMRQARFGEAAIFFGRAVEASTNEPVFAFNLGLALSRLGKTDEAERALRAALKLRPDFGQALFELGAILHQTGKTDEAEEHFRHAIKLMPTHDHAKLALASLLVDAERPKEAEAVLLKTPMESMEPRLKAQLHLQLAQALRRQRKDVEALAALEQAEAAHPALPGIPRHRAETLQNLNRFDEAAMVFEKEIARMPADPVLHHDYNALLYQLGRTDEFLKSYDRAPDTRELRLGKASLLARERRHEEAYSIYEELKWRDPGDRAAITGAARALTALGRHADAGALYDSMLEWHGGDPQVLGIAAEPALLSGDPHKAAWLCERGLAKYPQNAFCLAVLSIASRMMGDGRDDFLNGYDGLVRSFDLDPPEGFSSMECFNAELDASLDRLHPRSRELIDQSLRGGTQTPGHLFSADLPLVALLRRRIDEAVARYIAELDDDPRHPLLSRRSRDFRYSGSWSSRLRDSGYHVNHFHPDGWISSCYYVSVPQAVEDETAMQGWIKFGEPAFDVILQHPVRRTIKPAPGRLVLFPSYTWHGTKPFRDQNARTTIAFDLVPKA